MESYTHSLYFRGENQSGYRWGELYFVNIHPVFTESPVFTDSEASYMVIPSGRLYPPLSYYCWEELLANWSLHHPKMDEEDNE